MSMLHYDEYGNKNKPTVLLLHGAGKSVDKVYDLNRMKQELFGLIDSLHKEKIGVIGHSLGGQLAIMLVCEQPARFGFAVFLSAWVNPSPKTVKMYCSLVGMATKILHIKWLVRFQGRYWNYTKEQADYMADYSRLITPQVYQSFFAIH